VSKSFSVFGVVRGSLHPAFRLHPISARQVGAVELNSPKHLSHEKFIRCHACLRAGIHHHRSSGFHVIPVSRLIFSASGVCVEIFERFVAR
jgi:hypothetical protein